MKKIVARIHSTAMTDLCYTPHPPAIEKFWLARTLTGPTLENTTISHVDIMIQEKVSQYQNFV